MESLIDTHTYFGRNDVLGVEVSPKIYEDLKKEIAQKYGYDAKFILMPYSKEGNKEVPKILADNPELFLGGFIQINPNLDFQDLIKYSSPEEIEKLIVESKGSIVGLKLHTTAARIRADDERLAPFAKLAMKYDLPILFHCSAAGQDFTKPDYFRNLKKIFPDLKIICAHYGGLNEEYIPEYVKLVKEYSDVYLNTTGLNGYKRRWEIKKWSENKDKPMEFFYLPACDRFEKIFLETIKEISDKVMFGSDHPELGEYMLYPVDKADEAIRRKVFSENAKKILKLKAKSN